MILSDSEYDLTNGVFQAGSVALGYPYPAHFNQYGGDATIAQLYLGTGSPAGSHGGAYALYGGNLRLPGGLRLTGDNGQPGEITPPQ